MKTVFMFGGQGSQYFQMGRELYDRHAGFARHMRRMDAMVRDLSGYSVVDALYGGRGRGEVFDELLLTHPAIFMVEHALAQVLIERGIEPDLMLGVSLGSVAACVAAGMWRAEDAMALVLRHAAWIVEHGKPGGMIAVLAGPHLHEAEPVLRQRSVVASYNGPAHMVLSADVSGMEAIEACLRSRDVLYARLPVRYPFHSPWLLEERAQAGRLDFSEPASVMGRVPIICSARAALLSSLPEHYFSSVALAPIQFELALRKAASQGPCRFIDLSPSSTLATSMKHLTSLDASSSVHGILNPFGRDIAGLEKLGSHG